MYFYLLCVLFVFVDSNIVIPLHRRKTPRELILNTNNIPQFDVWLDWLKRPYSEYRTNDTIPLLRFLDTEFYALINVGSPGKRMKVTFDTAWSTSWIISNDCPATKFGCWFHKKYNHHGSSTYRKNGQPYVANEGSYNISGYYSSDVLKIGHTKVNQTFVEIDNLPYWYIFSYTDGVIGLGLPYSNVNPFFSNILAQTNITKPVFSIYMNRVRTSEKGGSIILGEIDEKHVHVTNGKADNITYVPINTASGLWEFNMDAINLKDGNETINICTSSCVGLADTSSNGIIVSQALLETINERIQAKPLAFGKFRVACNTITTLPLINFIIGGTNFTLTGKEYTQTISIGPVTLCVSAFTAATAVSEQNRWILGGAFLAKYYTIYDLGGKQMGFVRAA